LCPSDEVGARERQIKDLQDTESGPPPPHPGQESAEDVEKKEEMRILDTESTESRHLYLHENEELAKREKSRGAWKLLKTQGTDSLYRADSRI